MSSAACAEDHRVLRRQLLVHDIGDHAGHVVGAAGGQGCTDQLDGGHVDGLRAEQLADLVVGEVVADPVAAQHQPVAGDRVDDRQVGLDLLPAVEGADEHDRCGCTRASPR
jgi:hypothetical protein